MAAPQGLFLIPGVQQILSGSMTFSHGISPSVASVQIAPQAGVIPTNTTLTITYGTGFKLQFPGCRVKSPSIQKGLDGRIMSFAVEDRRWKWRYGRIFGRYNLKRADGTIDTLRSKEKTPQELAKILLKEMKEQGFDVSAMPNKLRPEVVWDGNNPAEALAELCDLLGCRIVLSPITNKVKLVVLGTGKSLPEGANRRTTGYGMELNGFPDSIEVITGPSLFQTKLKLEPVGLDVDGRIRPIDELSYKPAAGWLNEHPEIFSGITNKADRRLAKRTVWRWYWFVSQADGSAAPPGFPTEVPVTRAQQFLPLRSQLLEQQLDQQKDPQDTQRQNFLPAYVEGIFGVRDFSFGNSDEEDFGDINKAASTDSKGNTTIGARYIGGFSIDAERGVVEFSDWIAKNATDTAIAEPELYLVCSYSVTNEDNLPLRYHVTRKIAKKPQGTGPRVIMAPDIQLMTIAKYDSTGKKVKKTTDNKTSVEKWCNELIDQAMKEYQQPETEEVEYAGFIKIDLDGKIQQVGWEFDKGGATTRASSNTEFDLYVPKFHELREQQKLRAIQGQIFRAPVIVGAK